jgi:hypothetical protein
MKWLIIIVFGFNILVGCTYRPKEKRLTQFINNDGRILKSFYRMNKDTIEFRRILTKESGLIVQAGQVFLGQFALTHQRFSSIKEFENLKTTLDSLENSFSDQGLVTKMTTEKDVMFIQIIPDSAMGTVDALRFLNLRQKIEGQLDEALQSRNLGEWFAGDVGAGANMLFFITDWDKANEEVIEILRQENLLDHVLITKRIGTSEDDWNYEVVYPLEYEGTFNQM